MGDLEQSFASIFIIRDSSVFIAPPASKVRQTRSHSGFGQWKRHRHFLDMQSNVAVHKAVKYTA